MVATAVIQSLNLDKMDCIKGDVVGIGPSPLPEHFCEVVRQLAERANLKHQVMYFHGELFHPMSLEGWVQLHFVPTIAGRFAADGRFYLTTVDFTRVLPSSDQHPLESRDDIHPFKQLRSELIAMNPIPLQSPAFKYSFLWTLCDINCSRYSLAGEAEDREEIKEACKRMWNDLAPACATFLESRILQHSEQFLSDAEATNYVEPGSSLSIQETVHSWGINTRYTGVVEVVRFCGSPHFFRLCSLTILQRVFSELK